MKKFRFKADITFDAEDAEQAASLIAKHFTWIQQQFAGMDIPDAEPWFVGDLKFEPECVEPKE